MDDGYLIVWLLAFAFFGFLVLATALGQVLRSWKVSQRRIQRAIYVPPSLRKAKSLPRYDVHEEVDMLVEDLAAKGLWL
ncbi:MAG TPA: hypothetical protein VFA10_14445 [Ktedonobacteraceae bacterium]|nr:hypothetical protein [Ktedonobacteraceae bacterium]